MTLNATPLSAQDLRLMDAYWRAANYLSVGQIYLFDNPLLREPLTMKHVKPRLLGHWGTTPGLNFIYVHLNRIIKNHNLSTLYVAGPGHGGPGLVANVYLEGTYSEFYPGIAQDEAGMKRLFTQFSFPGGIPSHVAPETPGSIHEGGELGYALSHAFGAAFDNPDLLVCAVVGDGEAETGALATSWHSNKFLNPARDGAVLPILHLNGAKIAGPTVLARISHDELENLFNTRHGTYVLRVKGNSMIDDHIADGDYVIIERRENARDGETVVALLDDGQATLKRFYKERNRVRLQPANSAMAPIYVDKDIKIQGVLIGVLRTYSKGATRASNN